MIATDESSLKVRRLGDVTLNFDEMPPHTPVMSIANRVARANTDCRGQNLLSEYQDRACLVPSDPWWNLENEDPVLLEPPWWDAAIKAPIRRDNEVLPIDIATLSAEALFHSSFIRVAAAEPLIRETDLTTQRANFDWLAYMETVYNDVNDPVGNTLTTGNNDRRYKNQNWDVSSGLKRRNELGGQVDLFQAWGREEDNSRFLLPNPQRTTRLELQYTQPLLRGAGCAYNHSQIVLARIQWNQSSDQVAKQIQEHLVRVTEAYWEIYRSRAEFLQYRKLLLSAKRILANLQGRQEVDAVQRQVFRARTAVADRESAMLRAETRIRNWQSRLRYLVNAPGLFTTGEEELIPIDPPQLEQVPLSMTDSLQTALVNRPDISQAIRETRAASVKLGVAKNEVLPRLDFVASSYVEGLADASDFARAFGNQFSDGRPSFSVGLNFEAPIGNRVAKAQMQRRQREFTRTINRFSLAVEGALTDVEIAVREVETSYREMVAKHRALVAAQRETDYLDDRWRVLPNGDDSAAQLLENLLDAQERVLEEERAMLSAQINYALSWIRLKSEMGTLLRYDLE